MGVRQHTKRVRDHGTFSVFENGNSHAMTLTKRLRIDLDSDAEVRVLEVTDGDETYLEVRKSDEHE
jgi:hypothetical protein